MLPLRIVAICSNIAFFTYAILLSLPPIAVLHATLLPINIWRLWQLSRDERARWPARPDLSIMLRYFARAATALALSLFLVSAAVSRIGDDTVDFRLCGLCVPDLACGNPARCAPVRSVSHRRDRGQPLTTSMAPTR
jgi:hypothetical protein